MKLDLGVRVLQASDTIAVKLDGVFGLAVCTNASKTPKDPFEGSAGAAV